MYINTTTLNQYREQEIRLLNPNTSFPFPFIPPEEYAYIFPTPIPEYSYVIQSTKEIVPILTNKGHWEQQWEIVELFQTQEEKDLAILLDLENKRKAAIPKSVSPRQIRQALTRSNLRIQVETAIVSGDQDTKDWWEFSTQFDRGHPQVVSMGIALGVSEVQLDDLWILAGTL